MDAKTLLHTALWRHQDRSHRAMAVRSPRTAAHSVLRSAQLHQLREHPGAPLQRISRADERRSWQCLRPSRQRAVAARAAIGRSERAGPRPAGRGTPPGTQSNAANSVSARAQANGGLREASGGKSGGIVLATAYWATSAQGGVTRQGVVLTYLLSLVIGSQ